MLWLNCNICEVNKENNKIHISFTLDDYDEDEETLYAIINVKPHFKHMTVKPVAIKHAGEWRFRSDISNQADRALLGELDTDKPVSYWYKLIKKTDNINCTILQYRYYIIIKN